LRSSDFRNRISIRKEGTCCSGQVKACLFYSKD
jgi:hypothetical protein